MRLDLDSREDVDMRTCADTRSSNTPMCTYTQTHHPHITGCPHNLHVGRGLFRKPCWEAMGLRGVLKKQTLSHEVPLTPVATSGV